MSPTPRRTRSALAWTLLPTGGLLASAQAPTGPVEVRVPVSRDTWISAAPGEEEGNNGGSSRVKTKSCQELTLLDLDPSALVGHVIEHAELHLRSASPDALRRASISSVASAWVEGHSQNYEREIGAASFRFAETGRRSWGAAAGDASDISGVIMGAGHTRWSFAEATPIDEHGWQTLRVDPRVVATRVAGVGFGFALFDDVGSEYTRDGEAFAYHPFPNRFAFSRESGAASAPYWTLCLGPEDRAPPLAVGAITSDIEESVEGVVELHWSVPEDVGPAGTLGFFVRFASDGAFEWDAARDVPQRLVPAAGLAGTSVSARLTDLGLEPGAEVVFAVRAVDAAGNLSSASTLTTHMPSVRGAPPLVALGASTKATVPERGALRDGDGLASNRVASLGATSIAVLDALDLETGARVPASSTSSELGPDTGKNVTLTSARNEWVDFQLALTRPFDDVRVRVAFDDPAIRAELYTAPGVATPTGRYPDPLVAWSGSSALGDEHASRADDRFALVFVDVYVGRAARPGRHTGRALVSALGSEVEIGIELDVHDFELPDRLSFVPEMNAYDLAPPPDEIAWYRLAHAHRTNLNVLRYDWKGRVHAACGPKIDGERFDWTEFDARFGPLLDGSAFHDSSRGAVAVDTFYLPLNENWPIPIEPHFRGGYWADEALDASYWRSFESASARIATHVRDRGWNDTLFEFCLNDKVYHKGTAWNGSSAPWILDEPTHTQDFFALAAFARAFKVGVESVTGAKNVVFRADVSRPQWQRGFLDDLLDVNVVGSEFGHYRARVLDRQRAFGERVFRYATANAVGESNATCAAWCIDTWCLGGDGVIPWQSVGTQGSWSRGDPLALLYPDRPGGAHGPHPSLRLKAFRRGEQDVEYLVAWMHSIGASREAVAKRVFESIDLRSSAHKSGADDAGDLCYPAVDGRRLRDLRHAVAHAIAEAPADAPAPFLPSTPVRRPAADIVLERPVR